MIGAEELAAWLLENGFAEERRGYGHVSAEELAEALTDAFVIYREGRSATEKAEDAALTRLRLNQD